MFARLRLIQSKFFCPRIPIYYNHLLCSPSHQQNTPPSPPPSVHWRGSVLPVSSTRSYHTRSIWVSIWVFHSALLMCGFLKYWFNVILNTSFLWLAPHYTVLHPKLKVTTDSSPPTRRIYLCEVHSPAMLGGWGASMDRCAILLRVCRQVSLPRLASR